MAKINYVTYRVLRPDGLTLYRAFVVEAQPSGQFKHCPATELKAVNMAFDIGGICEMVTEYKPLRKIL